MLLCRYAKRRGPPEPLPSLDAAAEQGRIRLFNFHGSKCSGGGCNCNKNFLQLCLCRCVSGNTDAKVVAAPQQHTIEESNKGPTNNMSTTGVINNDQLAKQNKGIEEEQNDLDNKSAACPTANSEAEVKNDDQQKEEKESGIVTTEDQHNNEEKTDFIGEAD